MPALMINQSKIAIFGVPKASFRALSAGCSQNCRKNIEFYKEQIDKLEEKMEDLEKLKEAYEYY